MSVYTEMYKGGKHKILIKTSKINHYLNNGFTLEPESETAPKKKTTIVKPKENTSSGEK